MIDYKTGYQSLNTLDEEETEPPADNIIHVVPDKSKSRWNHVEDLDDFFTRIYQYHQRSGLFCNLCSLYHFLCFYGSALITKRYFMKIKCRTTHIKLPYTKPFDPLLICCLLVAGLFWTLRFLKVVYHCFKYYEIKLFYNNALRISSDELLNVTWHEVQLRLRDAQLEQQMCIHKRELSELDIYQRILSTFLTTGLKYNVQMILFWGPWAPFENNWHLKQEYKSHHKRTEVADRLSKHILWIGIANLVLSPVILLWQVLYVFFRYVEVIKREPGFLGARRWSSFARLYLRHFNELEHEFSARLNRAYRPAERYMGIFSSPSLAVIAKHLAFVAGSILAALIILTVIDEDVLAVQHVIGVMTVCGAVIAVCRSAIPDENLVWCPELMMKAVLAQVHYMPDTWRGQAHTYRVRDEFSRLFQYKFIYLLEELFSPLITPLILVFSLRHKSLAIVDFLRNFTIDVIGVGDVCSFAQMDIRKHGNPDWVSEDKTDANRDQQAEDGKCEMSLMHFHLTNPEWQPSTTGRHYLKELKEQAQREALVPTGLPQDNPLMSSMNSMTSMGVRLPTAFTQPAETVTAEHHGGELPSIQAPPIQAPPSLMPMSSLGPYTSLSPLSSSVRLAPEPLRGGGIRNAEGPARGANNGILASINCTSPDHSSITASSMLPSISLPYASQLQQRPDEATLEFLSTEMSFSALYLHEVHRRRAQTTAAVGRGGTSAGGSWNLDSHLSSSTRQISHESQRVAQDAREMWRIPEESPPRDDDVIQRDSKVTFDARAAVDIPLEMPPSELLPLLNEPRPGGSKV